LHHEDGSPLSQGDIVGIPHLADTLRSIARDPASLYGGELGQQIATGVRANGGLLGIEDLQAYEAVERVPVRATIGDWDVATNPPPAVGGSCLAAMLLLLERLGPGDSLEESVRHMVTAQRAVLGFRSEHLDGAHEALPDKVERLLALADLADPTLLSAPSTSHISVVDTDGLACAITASAGYGSGAMIEGTGFWLNNSLGELDLLTKGLSGVTPGTRLASNMAPTIAKRRSDGAVVAIGSPGASRITTAIAQVLVNFASKNMNLLDAINYPRLHVELAADPGARPAGCIDAGPETQAIQRTVNVLRRRTGSIRITPRWLAWNCRCTQGGQRRQRLDKLPCIKLKAVAAGTNLVRALKIDLLR
jgi:gamma-glutamyltranspeptidase/glutathione hydrolase